MRKILIIDNFDSFTFNLVEYFKKAGCEVLVYRNTVNPQKIDQIKPDAIVFSPGPSVPEKAGNMMEIIKLYHQKYPMLGICLGHQAFVEFFGGSLKFVDPVHGMASSISHDGKTIFQTIPQNFFAGRYHSLAANKMPDCLEISATHGDIVMALRHKTLPIEGVQFHPESVLSMKGEAGYKIIRNFLNKYVPTLKSFLEGDLSQVDQEEFLKEKYGYTAQELAEAVLFLREKMSKKIEINDAIDICGTGGSGLNRINTSTISAFILASLGVGVAKHGNRAASGRCGSFDLLEELGVNFDLDRQGLESIYELKNLNFFFARDFHPLLKNFADLRRKIGVPTFFNLLGPLLNPAEVDRQIIGTAFPEKMELIAETCRLLNKKHVLVVCGEDGLDEVTLTGKTFVVELIDGEIKKYIISPEDFGIQTAKFEEISGGDKKTNAKIACEILNGKCETRHLDLVLVNAALALKLSRKVKTLKEGYKMAKKAVEKDLTGEFFEQFKLLSNLNSNYLNILSCEKKSLENRRSKISSVKTGRRRFFQALHFSKKAIIAEIKRKSPSVGVLIDENFSLEKQVEAYVNGGASAISVLTNEKHFDGSIADIKCVADIDPEIPVLCKGFIIDEYQIFEARKNGADAILLIASILSQKQIEKFLKIAGDLGMDAICEVHNVDELNKVLETGADIIGINNRDLKTFEINLDTVNELTSLVPKNKIIISESGVKTIEDINAMPKNINAVLVGTTLMTSKNPEKEILKLRGKPMIKICGIKNAKDAAFCEKNGVDFVGLNFVPTSKRFIDLQEGILIRKELKNTKVAGVFQNQSLEYVNSVVENLDLDFIQLSGDESLNFVKNCTRPVIKTIQVKSSADLKKAEKFYEAGAIILFDSEKPGSGKSFNHKFIKDFNKPYFLAGGINPLNLKKIQLRPMCFDIASGVESRGVFDRKKLLSILN